MIQITYVSDTAFGLAPDEVFRIIETSARNNLRDDLTGFLVFSENRFFQLVEGPQQAIENLLARLERDPRHGNIDILSRKAVAERSFPRWQMKRLPTGAELWSVIEQSVDAGKLDPQVQVALRQFGEREKAPVAN